MLLLDASGPPAVPAPGCAEQCFPTLLDNLLNCGVAGSGTRALGMQTPLGQAIGPIAPGSLVCAPPFAPLSAGAPPVLLESPRTKFSLVEEGESQTMEKQEKCL